MLLTLNLLTLDTVKDAAADENEEEEHVATKDPIQVQREKRFLMFASVEYDGSVYMTPQDFLESILNSSARGLCLLVEVTSSW